MEIQHIALAISVANLALTWGVALYMYLANKNKVTNVRINKLQEDIDEWKFDHSERIVVLETSVKSVPTHDDLGGIHERITDVGLKVSSQGAKLDGIDATLRMLLARITERGMP